MPNFSLVNMIWTFLDFRNSFKIFLYCKMIYCQFLSKSIILKIVQALIYIKLKCTDLVSENSAYSNQQILVYRI